MRLLTSEHRRAAASRAAAGAATATGGAATGGAAHSVDRCKDLMQRNESALQQLRVASESATARQEQQLDQSAGDAAHVGESSDDADAALRGDRRAACTERGAAATSGGGDGATVGRVAGGGDGAGAGDAAVPRGESGETRDARDGAGGESEDATAPVPLAALRSRWRRGRRGRRRRWRMIITCRGCVVRLRRRSCRRLW